MKNRVLSLMEFAVIIVLAIVPLFANFPYRINIFLSWEGAYRLSEGQLPFRDFGTPLGSMYWVIPGIFFKIFGPQMITLLKAQTFINIIAGLAFRSILKNTGTNPGIRFVSVLLFCISYSFFNFWPWYNHSVIMYELVALAFLFLYMNRNRGKSGFVYLVLSALFTCFSFLTKQDGGGLALLTGCFLLAYDCLMEKKWVPLLIYAGSSFVLFFLLILPFLGHGFGYWFNHGQPPHTARISIADIGNEFFASSQWIKFYLFLIILFLVIRFRNWTEFWANRNIVLFTLLTISILGEAAIFQVTSYIPPDNNIFFHSFAIAYLLTIIPVPDNIRFEKNNMIIICTAGILLWWSGVYWKYIQRVFIGPAPAVAVAAGGENIVNRSTYKIDNDTTDVPLEKWVLSPFKSFERIYMPPQTIAGIQRILEMDVVKSKKALKVLNMSELTPLAKEIPYELERNPELPLWYHLGVGMFNKQAEIYEQRIRDNYYDLILFEYIPGLNNFYPFRIRRVLQEHYQLKDIFKAPRRSDGDSNIEVYTPRAPL